MFRRNWALLVGFVGLASIGWVLLSLRPRVAPHPGTAREERPIRGRPHVRGTVEVLVRVRIRVLGANEGPVSGARVIAGLREFLTTDEDVASMRAAIEVRLANGTGAWKFASGTTDPRGIVELEYTRFADAGNPFFGEGAQDAAAEFPFGASVRIDSEEYGTVFRELVDPKNVRYRRGNTGPDAEAEFVIRCDVGGPVPVPSASSAETDIMKAAFDAARKAREARGEK